MKQIHGDACQQQGVLHQRQHRGQLGPREVERLEVLEASRPKHAALQRLATRRQLGKEALGVDARERRERLLAREVMPRITPAYELGPGATGVWCPSG